jgi:flagellar capping protein FliD
MSDWVSEDFELTAVELIGEGDLVDFEGTYRAEVELMRRAGLDDSDEAFGDMMSNLMCAEDHYFEVEGVVIETPNCTVVYSPDGSWAFPHGTMIPARRLDRE